MNSILKKLTFTALLCTMLLPLVSCIRKNTPNQGTADDKLDHLVILEVFYTDIFKGRMYNDKEIGTTDGYPPHYIKIHNPTDEVKYLDGLGIATSALTTTDELTITQNDFREESTAVYYTIHFPGSGKDYPIQPGATVIVTATARDLRKDFNWDEENYEGYQGNPGSIDMSVADFEWLQPEDYKYKTADGLEDNLDVPNMIFSYYRPDARFTYFRLRHDQAIILFNFPAENFKKENIGKLVQNYEIRFTVTDTSNTLEMSDVVIPNSSIIDAVVISPTLGFRTRPISEKIDAGYMGVSEVKLTGHTRKQRPDYGKALRRLHDGKKWVDTNNSTVDFEVVDLSNSKEYKTPPTKPVTTE